jgi:hypothetical protein
MPRAKGTGVRTRAIAGFITLFRKGLLAVFRHGCGAAPGRGTHRRPSGGGAFDHDPVAVERDERASKRPAQPRWGRPHRLIKRFEFGELDRSFIAAMGDGAAEEPQSDLGGQMRKLRRVEPDWTALRPRWRRQRLPCRSDGDLDRQICSPHARSKPRQAVRA